MRENDLIRTLRERIRDPDGVLGIGDDCCVWTPNGRTCLSTDTIVEGRHFRATDQPALIGRKAAGAGWRPRMHHERMGVRWRLRRKSAIV